VKIRRGRWNDDLFRVLEGFPDLAHDDEIDACSGALEMLNPQMKGYAIFELTRRRAEAAARGEEYVPPPIEDGLPDLMEMYRKAREDLHRGQK
jgi:hypothetical protein